VIHHFNSVSSFATHAVVPASGAVRIDPQFDLDAAALLSCAVLTGAGAVFNTAAVPAGASVAVIGCGGVGLSVVEAARIAGASPIVAIDTRTRNLELARSVGATHVVDAASAEVRGSVRKISPGGVDYAFEAVGSGPTIEEAWGLTAVGGATVVVGLAPKGTVAGINTWGFISEKRILGCFMGSSRPDVDVPRLAALVDSGELRLDAMATDRVRLAELPRALEAVKAGESVRCLIVNDQ
jgi:S-(hydroxymethyl)glutathione dehydrogenase/alcohol dehydrogenase